MTALEQLNVALAHSYHLSRELGEGGMATVYLARDLKHERDVAIKVLKPELGAVLGVERFNSEIRVTANLQHPNLLPLFESGEAGGLLFYVMPFVDGETLRARLEREKQLPVDEAVRLSVAIAHALDYAHRRGVIHRDLKPENILLADGQPLVADFGIALAVSKAGGQRVTQTGLSLGTPQYMSPEQATGDRTVDARTDIYSLGAMTYEMLTGEPPHIGNTAQAIIARLMTEEVRPLTLLRRSVPAPLDAAVRHALEKLAADRFATAGEFALALQGKGDAATIARYLPAAEGTTASAGGRRVWREAAAWVVAAGALAALAFASTREPAVTETPVVRVKIDPPPGERIMLGWFPIALSPLGDQMAYVTQSTAGYRTLVQRVGELDAYTELAATSLQNLVFSPDGKSIAYTSGDEIRRVAATGGRSEVLGKLRQLTSLVTRGNLDAAALVWTPDDQILIGSDVGLFMLPARGGVMRPVTDTTNQFWARFPVLLPDGKTVLVATGTRNLMRLVAVSLTNGQITETGVRAAQAFGVVDGHLLFRLEAGDLFAIPFDVKSHTATGEPLPIAREVEGVGLSASGTLTYGLGQTAFQLVLAGGGADQLLRSEAAAYNTPRFSPNGERVALSLRSGDGEDIWTLDRAAGTFTRLTTDGFNSAPEWTADGKRVLYKSVRTGGNNDAPNGTVRIMWQRIDGSAPAELLFETASTLNEAVLSADGRWLVVRTAPGGNTPRDIFAVDLTGDRALRPMATGPTSEVMPRLSPDGRWLAYQSDQSGRAEIYVRSFPGDGARVQVSNDGGSEPLWDAAGRTLYYRAPAGITAVALSPGAELTVGARRLVLPSSEAADPTHPSYDVSPDGKQFLVLRPVGGEAKAIVIHNWRRELRELVQRGRPK